MKANINCIPKANTITETTTLKNKGILKSSTATIATLTTLVEKLFTTFFLYIALVFFSWQ